MRRARGLLAGLALALSVLPAEAQTGCRLALALGLDVSSSVDDREYALQRDGLAAALLHPDVARAFLGGPGPVALAVFEWSGIRQQALVVDWRLVTSVEVLRAAAAALRAHPRSYDEFPTALGYALGYAHSLMRRAPGDCLFRTLDISGDGRNNDGFPPASAYRAFAYREITVNGLAVTEGAGDPEGIEAYYRDELIRGPGSFVEVAEGYDDFARAMRRKLERELGVQVLGSLAPGAGE